MQQPLIVEKLANGMVVLAESMPWLRSAAFSLIVPSGTLREPHQQGGLGGIALEMAQRGAGSRDSHEIVDALDFLGVDRSSSVTTYHSVFSAAMLAEVLDQTLEIYADIVRHPHLPLEELEDAKQVAIQELHAMEDDPSHRCLTELKRSRYSDPFGRSAFGTEEGIQSVKLGDVQRVVERFFVPNESILAVAGTFDWPKLRDRIEEYFGSWKPRVLEPIPELKVRTGVSHIPHESAQTHIALAYDCVPYTHPEYYHGRGLVGILSDGMSSRLFTEVREKRGLVYTVSASSHSLAGKGSVLCYAGTTDDRAQETLEVVIQTIQSLTHGIADGELSRLKTRVKTGLVTEQESCVSRSSQIATDWFYLGRVPPRAEVSAKIEALTSDSLVEHFHRYPARNWSLVTLGNRPLEMPSGI